MAFRRKNAGGALIIFTTEVRNIWSVGLHAFLTTYILQAPTACKARSLQAHVSWIKFYARTHTHTHKTVDSRQHLIPSSQTQNFITTRSETSRRHRSRKIIWNELINGFQQVYYSYRHLLTECPFQMLVTYVLTSKRKPAFHNRAWEMLNAYVFTHSENLHWIASNLKSATPKEGRIKPPDRTQMRHVHFNSPNISDEAILHPTRVRRWAYPLACRLSSQKKNHGFP